MNRIVPIVTLLCLAAGCATSKGTRPTTRPATQPVQVPDKPAIKVDKEGNPNPAFMKMHESFVRHIDLLFLGDSITNGWRKNGADAWKDNYAARYNPANFGIGGDRTQHVLWRITNGELDGIRPKVTVLMIGTNNIRSDDPAAIARGIARIVKTIRTKTGGKVLLLGIFPRGETSAAPERAKQRQVNEIIARLDDGQNVRYLEIWNEFLQPDQSLSKEIMPDFLHLTPKGYAIWAKSMDKLLTEMMQ